MEHPFHGDSIPQRLAFAKRNFLCGRYRFRPQRFFAYPLEEFMRKSTAIAVLPFFLAACGGGSDSSGSSSAGATSAAGASVALSGQVTDGPIAGAQVCLYLDGTQAHDASGAAICSSATDAQGNYTINVPRNLASGFLTLVAKSGSYIKLASSLGTVSQVLQAAGSSATLTSANLPAAQITHFSTAAFALADTNGDGTVSQAEFSAYVADYTKLRTPAAVIKAAIDGGQSTTLIGGQTGDTLRLAMAAVSNQTLGTSGQTATQWAAASTNASVIAAVDQDAAASASGNLANYQISTVVTSSQSPQPVTNGSATIFCHVNTSNETATVQIAFDASRGIMILKHDDVQTVGSYNPQTGAISLTENDPLAVSDATSSVTYYSEGYFKLNGTVDASTGNIKGSYSEMTANTWSLDGTREVCTAEGSVTATKL